MNDPRANQLQAGQADNSQVRESTGMAERLQQALRSLGGLRPGAGNGSITPDALSELARRAGLTSPGQMADLARMMGVSGEVVEGTGIPQHIVFAVGDVECALPAETVQAVEGIGDITLVPNTAPWVLGIIHLRGSILSVVDLRGFFGFPSQAVTKRSRLLVVTKRDMTIGMVVDAVTEMRTFDGDAGGAARAPIPPWAAPYADEGMGLNGRLIVMLDPERLLHADKMHRYRADFS
jgi:purine-binding chemotaxis protein CheW